MPTVCEWRWLVRRIISYICKGVANEGQLWYMRGIELCKQRRTFTNTYLQRQFWSLGLSRSVTPHHREVLEQVAPSAGSCGRSNTQNIFGRCICRSIVVKPAKIDRHHALSGHMVCKNYLRKTAQKRHYKALVILFQVGRYMPDSWLAKTNLRYYMF